MKRNNNDKHDIEIETKISFKTMLKILFCSKAKTNGEITNKTFALLTSLIFYLLGYGLLILDLIFVFAIPVYYIFSYDWNEVLVGVISICLLIPFIVAVFLFSVLLVGTAKEQEKKDANSTIVVFSAIVSFVALIVAVIALFK